MPDGRMVLVLPPSPVFNVDQFVSSQDMSYVPYQLPSWLGSTPSLLFLIWLLLRWNYGAPTMYIMVVLPTALGAGLTCCFLESHLFHKAFDINLLSYSNEAHITDLFSPLPSTLSFVVSLTSDFRFSALVAITEYSPDMPSSSCFRIWPLGHATQISDCVAPFLIFQRNVAVVYCQLNWETSFMGCLALSSSNHFPNCFSSCCCPKGGEGG